MNVLPRSKPATNADKGSRSREDESELVHALIDSGAMDSCIDEALALKIGLPVIDVQMVSGVSGAKLHNVYLGKIDIPGLGFYQYGRFTGVHLKTGGQFSG